MKNSQMSGCINQQQSPFSQLACACFYLDDFEDELFTIRGEDHSAPYSAETAAGTGNATK